MNRVHVLVEGQTEEAFVGRVLRPHLDGFGVFPTPVIAVTRRVDTGPNFRGGLSSWGKADGDIRRLCGDTSVVAITTMLDYYGLPVDAPGMTDRPSPATAEARILHVEGAIDVAISDARFRCFLAKHEFEALLYADPGRCGTYLQDAALERAMRSAVKHCGEPEMVNDDPQTAPSKRIVRACPGYVKTLHGPALVEDIGLAAIRGACPHFAGWLGWLESLG